MKNTTKFVYIISAFFVNDGRVSVFECVCARGNVCNVYLFELLTDFC